jgi:hypothetical protein
MFFDHVAAVRRISIESDEDSQGRVSPYLRPTFWPDHDPDLRKVVGEIGVRLAGPIAEKMFTGRTNHHGASADHRAASELANFVSIDYGEDEGAHGNLLIRWIAPLVKARLRVHWYAVEALAEALLERKTLTGKAAREVIRAATLKRMPGAGAAIDGGGEA